jgi:hypothetical protein
LFLVNPVEGMLYSIDIKKKKETRKDIGRCAYLERAFVSGNNIIGLISSNHGACKIDVDTKKILVYQRFTNSERYYEYWTNITVVDGYVLYGDTIGNVFAVPDSCYGEVTEDKIIDKETTADMILEGRFPDISISESGDILQNGVYRTLEFEKFMKFYYPRRTGKYDPAVTWKLGDTKTFYANYLGEDSRGNMYWGDLDKVGIFNKKGAFVREIDCTVPGTEFVREPTVAPNGDLYLIRFDRKGSKGITEKIDFYRMRCTW